ncbi:uncharacterized protein LOC129291406 isoform X4 [Prosopis cineraria]|uniref:uncharacterized protein LOC129291406 isoform X4 n=1 Tax=Prosopis cineraria TaxID=364024 RepID=UPI00240FAC70|nr:uncharacterized protein LOC129291406 isoform X4 [Prosopis cineraria]
MTTFKPVNIVINTRLVAGSDRSIPAPRISPMAGLPHGSMFSLYTTRPKICYMKQLSCSSACCRLFANENKALLVSRLSRIKTGSFKYDDKDSYEASKPKDVLERKDSINSDVLLDGKEGYNVGIPFLVMMAIAMGIAVTATLISIYQQPILGSSFVVRSLSESSSSSAVDPAAAGFSFKVFGYKIILPEYAPGWIYFWLLMAPGCGLFISEEVLNIWLGIGKEKALGITKVVQKYGNLIGFVQRFSLGARNPTAFLAGAMGISAELFFAGVCCGGLFTLPLQLGIGFLLRERPLFAVATVMGIWTIFPYALAGLTALFFYLRRPYST